jgi:hypothetical protein
LFEKGVNVHKLLKAATKATPSRPFVPEATRRWYIYYSTRAPRVCEDLLHASTSPQVEIARNCELAKCRGDEGGRRRRRRAARARRDRSRRRKDRSIMLRLATAPSPTPFVKRWNHSSMKDSEDTGIRKQPDALLLCSHAQSPHYLPRPYWSLEHSRCRLLMNVHHLRGRVEADVRVIISANTSRPR